MTGREFGEALEREIVKLNLRLGSPPWIENLTDAVRAALKDAGPKPMPENWHVCERCGANPMELDRLRARDRWITDHAVPALINYEYGLSDGGGMARRALLALPKDEPQGEQPCSTT